MRSKNEANDKPDMKERLCKALDIVPDMLPSEGTIEIRGRNSVFVSEGGRILQYTEELVSVEYGRGRADIKGKRLCCSSYYKGGVRIDGHIRSVELWGTKK